MTVCSHLFVYKATHKLTYQFLVQENEQDQARHKLLKLNIILEGLISFVKTSTKSPFCNVPTLYTSGEPHRVASSIYEPPLSQPSIPLLANRLCVLKVHDSSMTKIFHSCKTMTPYSTWTDTILGMMLYRSAKTTYWLTTVKQGTTSIPELYHVCVELVLINIFRLWNFSNILSTWDRMQRSCVCTWTLLHRTFEIMYIHV